jgi:hypothetical protein
MKLKEHNFDAPYNVIRLARSPEEIKHLLKLQKMYKKKYQQHENLVAGILVTHLRRQSNMIPKPYFLLIRDDKLELA